MRGRQPAHSCSLEAVWIIFSMQVKFRNVKETIVNYIDIKKDFVIEFIDFLLVCLNLELLRVL